MTLLPFFLDDPSSSLSTWNNNKPTRKTHTPPTSHELLCFYTLTFFLVFFLSSPFWDPIQKDWMQQQCQEPPLLCSSSTSKATSSSGATTAATSPPSMPNASSSNSSTNMMICNLNRQLIRSELHARLVDSVRSDESLTRLKILQQETASDGNQFPFKEATGILLNLSAIDGIYPSTPNTVSWMW